MMEHISAALQNAGAVTGLVNSAATAAQSIKGLLGKPDADTVQIRQQVSELLDRLIEIQTKHASIQRDLLDLEERERRRIHFIGEAARYALQRTELGALIYELKPSHANGEPAHAICASCYDQGVKSILQPVGHNTLGCGRCEGRFLAPDGRSSPMIAQRDRPRGF
ncbi:hypothetical protein [Neomegalonema sp.]|uniref:hypothetical protein n=1 Tax=Neomegalonema sp. TaxID=2039713 RepID=UPI002637D122|nr:hypothetical protein [Neomegalonema sp.]MDD2870114.1 hypothetical protein [Neomegalonema sp.]